MTAFQDAKKKAEKIFDEMESQSRQLTEQTA
jgi:hypothetical protein